MTSSDPESKGAVEGDVWVGKAPGLRKGISRRVFLYRGSIVAGVGAAVATVPGLSGLLASTAAEGPEIDSAARVAVSRSFGRIVVCTAIGPLLRRTRQGSNIIVFN